MLDVADSPLSLMVRKLSLWRRLDDADKQAVLALPQTRRMFEPGDYIVEEGDRADYSCMVRSGFVDRQKIVGSGARQIVGVHIPGDMVDLQNSLLAYADHNVQALTTVQAVLIPREAIIALALSRPNVGMAMWYDTLVDASILREWTASIGRRSAEARLAHLLCELLVRLRAIGMANGGQYDIPMSQEQLADCTGMTAIHLNRMLMGLERTGAIARRGRALSVTDWKALVAAGDFDPAYLHLDEAAARSGDRLAAAS